MDPPVKLTSAQRALLHRIKEAREWYQGSDPDTRFRRDPFPPACVRMGRGGDGRPDLKSSRLEHPLRLHQGGRAQN